MKTEVIISAIERGIDLASGWPHNDETAVFLEGLAMACEYSLGNPADPLRSVWNRVKRLQAIVMEDASVEKEKKQAETDRAIAQIRDVEAEMEVKPECGMQCLEPAQTCDVPEEEAPCVPHEKSGTAVTALLVATALCGDSPLVAPTINPVLPPADSGGDD
jgi:hypothetical protein